MLRVPTRVWGRPPTKRSITETDGLVSVALKKSTQWIRASVKPPILSAYHSVQRPLGVNILMVLGHSSCGAVKAMMEGKAVPGQIGALYAPTWLAVEAAGGNLDAAIDANARIQANLLSMTSTIVAGAIREGKLKVVPARYDIASGKVSLLA